MSTDLVTSNGASLQQNTLLEFNRDTVALIGTETLTEEINQALNDTNERIARIERAAAKEVKSLANSAIKAVTQMLPLNSIRKLQAATNMLFEDSDLTLRCTIKLYIPEDENKYGISPLTLNDQEFETKANGVKLEGTVNTSWTHEKVAKATVGEAAFHIVPDRSSTTRAATKLPWRFPGADKDMWFFAHITTSALQADRFDTLQDLNEQYRDAQYRKLELHKKRNDLPTVQRKILYTLQKAALESTEEGRHVLNQVDKVVDAMRKSINL